MGIALGVKVGQCGAVVRGVAHGEILVYLQVVRYTLEYEVRPMHEVYVRMEYPN
jgi:uridine phosphorylase